MHDIGLYRRYLNEYIQEAIANSDGSNAGISAHLWEIRVSGLFVRNKKERNHALAEARKAFDEHRHWPVDIVLSHLGLEPKDFQR